MILSTPFSVVYCNQIKPLSFIAKTVGTQNNLIHGVCWDKNGILTTYAIMLNFCANSDITAYWLKTTESTSYSFVWKIFKMLGFSSLVEPASNSKAWGEICSLLQTKSNTFWPCCRWWRNPVWSQDDDRKKDQKEKKVMLLDLPCHGPQDAIVANNQGWFQGPLQGFLWE